MKLQDQEEIITEIKHKNYPPFRQEDGARLGLVGFMMTIGILLLIKNGDYTLFFLTLFILLIILVPLLYRWYNITERSYYLTNQRLIFYNNSHRIIEKSFDLNNFPKMTLRENAYNYGFIIIGKTEPLIDFTNESLIKQGRGMNLQDHKYVIDNIPDVRKIYSLIDNEIKNAKKN